MAFQATVSNKNFIIIAVYGLHTIRDRKDLWINLLQVRNNRTIAMFIFGDFNAILRATDRLNGAEVSEAEILDFTHIYLNLTLLKHQVVGFVILGTTKVRGRITFVVELTRHFSMMKC